MTTDEIQTYFGEKIAEEFPEVRRETGEITAVAGEDGRFVGTVRATLYANLAGGRQVYAAVGKTEKGIQIVKLGRSECLTPDEGDLDFLLKKELDIGELE